jgi:hypothetical protein
MDRPQRPYRRDCRNAESEKDDVEHGELVQGGAGMRSFINADRGGVVRIAELQADGYVYLRP